MIFDTSCLFGTSRGIMISPVDSKFLESKTLISQDMNPNHSTSTLDFQDLKSKSELPLEKLRK